MKRFIVILFIVIAVAGNAAATMEDTASFGRFGKVVLYRETPHPSRVVLFVSGDGGWNLGVVDMARALAGEDALVVGIDIIHYLAELEKSSEKCSYPAADFEALSQYIQKKLDFPDYTIPMMVGYSSGATLVYALLVQAPPNTFAGAISMGFCPDLPLTKPFCRGNGLEWEPGPKGKGYSFLPCSTLTEPWVAFQGVIDQVCNAKDVEAYVKQVKTAKLVLLDKVGHGFSVQRNWLPQLRQEMTAIANQQTQISPPEPTTGEVKGLPLVELPVKDPDNDILAVIISGDGGWASIDRQMGEYLCSQGVSVVGLNSLKYFWTRRTPDSAALDLQRIITHYLAAWGDRQLILIGYSRGADVLPFMANRLPAEIKAKVRGVALLGLEESVDFQFHLSEWLGGGSNKNDLPVEPEVDKLAGLKVLCFYGEDEEHSICTQLDTMIAQPILLRGGHHFGGEYKTIARIILERLGR
jgi:type IV secretory pathway VirJ component